MLPWRLSVSVLTCNYAAWSVMKSTEGGRCVCCVCATNTGRPPRTLTFDFITETSTFDACQVHLRVCRNNDDIYWADSVTFTCYWLMMRMNPPPTGSLIVMMQKWEYFRWLWKVELPVHFVTSVEVNITVIICLFVLVAKNPQRLVMDSAGIWQMISCWPDFACNCDLEFLL